MMRPSLKGTLLFCFALFFIFITQSFSDDRDLPGFRVVGRHLYDRCGEKVILIGVNEMFVWASGNENGASIYPEIEKTGANVVRIVWTTSGAVSTLDANIRNCVAHNMIPMPELHDATGRLEDVPAMVDWWVRPEVVNTLNQHEEYLLINIANEAGNHNVSNADFLSTYKTAITRMRDAGYRVPLIIDAPGWGQNITVLHNTWQELLDHDPLKNIMFSVHTWWIDPNDGASARVTRELQKAADDGMPLHIGEFAPMGVNCSRHFDYRHLLAECRRLDIGHLAWSWGWVANGDCAEMGMTTDGIYGNWRDTPNDGMWGQVVVESDTNSIQNTAVRPLSMLNGSCSGDGVRLEVKVEGEGIVLRNPTSTFVDHGTVIGLKALPSDRYVFQGWSGDMESTNDSITLTMDDNISVTATFIPDPDAPMLVNGDFLAGNEGWSWYVHAEDGASASLSTDTGKAVVSIADGGTDVWHVQMTQRGIFLEEGKDYTISFDAMAGEERDMLLALKYNGTPWTEYFSQDITLSTSMQRYTYTFTMGNETDTDSRLEFNMGTGGSTISIDNVELRQAASSNITKERLNYSATPKMKVVNNNVEYFSRSASPWTINAFDMRGRLVASNSGAGNAISLTLSPLRGRHLLLITFTQDGSTVTNRLTFWTR
ncbi:carbohydrate binding domain-containing protein [Chitinispirillales bacterium ANBcel5]|uniref:carbohydrate binding domain-containing protein n=1 Tax=Cellulosispirillum alkaliphilum TaxID=3039283 RepID=UPI002A593B18|nr:carbohydrate binding domain-containing protein [Chitinispirillales bacterium ANBcel5]